MNTRSALLKTEWTDPVTGAKGYLVIDRLIGGFCGGGIRMRPGLTCEEVERLARIMTYKLVGLGTIAAGGAKGGIDFDPADPRSRGVLRRYLEAHRPFLLECWATSEDLGTRGEEIQQIVGELGLETSVHCMIAKSNDPTTLKEHLIRCLRLVVDGLPIADVVTGFGVAEVTAEILAHLGKDITGSTVALQGFGSVGGSAALYLHRRGAKVVAVADVHGTIYNSAGLDVEVLLKHRNRRGEIERSGLPAEYQQLPRDAWLSLTVDVLVPAAVADVIHEGNVDKVSASLVVEGANIPTTPEAERVLHQRGVMVIPDFIANAGGAGLFGVVLSQSTAADGEAILRRLGEQLRTMTAQAFRYAEEHGLTLREAAVRMIEERIRDLESLNV